MIEKLREATKELHESIEKENLAYLIINHQIEVTEYKLLLLQNYVAHAITEKAIEEYYELESPLKNELLLKDLLALGVKNEVINSNLKKFKNTFSINDKYEALGAKYVVDGSALGGMLIAKNLPLCKNLNDMPQPYFFNGDRAQIKQWNRFSKILNKNYSEEEESLSIHKAKETFIFFGKVFSKASLQLQSVNPNLI